MISGDLGSSVGAAAPPPGVIPDFENPPRDLTALLVVLGICLATSTLLVWIRLFTRVFVLERYALEDYVVLVAWAAFIGYVALNLLELRYGAGVHQWDVTKEDYAQLLQLDNGIVIFFYGLVFLVKFAILIQYIHMLRPRHAGKTYRTIQAVIGTNFVFYIASIFSHAFSCSPRERIWNKSIDGHCINGSALALTDFIFNIISDSVILVLPIGLLWRKHMSRKKKWGISAVFATGLLACACSIIRLVLATAVLSTSKDLTYDLVPLAYFSILEIASGLICVSLPILPTFLSHYIPLFQHQVSRAPSSDYHTPSLSHSLAATFPLPPTSQPRAHTISTLRSTPIDTEFPKSPSLIPSKYEGLEVVTEGHGPSQTWQVNSSQTGGRKATGFGWKMSSQEMLGATAARSAQDDLNRKARAGSEQSSTAWRDRAQEPIFPNSNSSNNHQLKARAASEAGQTILSQTTEREEREGRMELQKQRRAQMLRGAYLELGEGEGSGDEDEDESMEKGKAEEVLGIGREELRRERKKSKDGYGERGKERSRDGHG